MKRKIDPSPTREVRLLDVVGTPQGNAVVVAIGPGGVYAKHGKTSGLLVRKTGRPVDFVPGAACKVGYYRFDQLRLPEVSFRIPAAAAPEESA